MHFAKPRRGASLGFHPMYYEENDAPRCTPSPTVPWLPECLVVSAPCRPGSFSELEYAIRRIQVANTGVQAIEWHRTNKEESGDLTTTSGFGGTCKRIQRTI